MQKGVEDLTKGVVRLAQVCGVFPAFRDTPTLKECAEQAKSRAAGESLSARGTSCSAARSPSLGLSNNLDNCLGDTLFPPTFDWQEAARNIAPRIDRSWKCRSKHKNILDLIAKKADTSLLKLLQVSVEDVHCMATVHRERKPFSSLPTTSCGIGEYKNAMRHPFFDTVTSHVPPISHQPKSAEIERPRHDDDLKFINDGTKVQRHDVLPDQCGLLRSPEKSISDHPTSTYSPFERHVDFVYPIVLREEHSGPQYRINAEAPREPCGVQQPLLRPKSANPVARRDLRMYVGGQGASPVRAAPTIGCNTSRLHVSAANSNTQNNWSLRSEGINSCDKADFIGNKVAISNAPVAANQMAFSGSHSERSGNDFMLHCDAQAEAETSVHAFANACVKKNTLDMVHPSRTVRNCP